MTMATLQEQFKEILSDSKFDVAHITFAKMVGCEPATLSRILNGHLQLRQKDKQKFALATQFIIALQASSMAPICFHSYKKIEPLWVEFQRSREQMREETELHAMAD
jgi:hypothetical protein